ncbi:MAG: hypothetical protein HY270_06120 [Deltaproteobacteria bacterium]|nr:hypothetical protein [Deltaproteobacteria bacterium]
MPVLHEFRRLTHTVLLATDSILISTCHHRDQYEHHLCHRQHHFDGHHGKKRAASQKELAAQLSYGDVSVQFFGPFRAAVRPGI